MFIPHTPSTVINSKECICLSISHPSCKLLLTSHYLNPNRQGLPHFSSVPSQYSLPWATPNCLYFPASALLFFHYSFFHAVSSILNALPSLHLVHLFIVVKQTAQASNWRQQQFCESALWSWISWDGSSVLQKELAGLSHAFVVSWQVD